MHLFVNNLTNVDFSYLDKQRGLVGETWLASITLEGALDEQGMVCDFGIVKKVVRQWLDTYLDHCLVVASQSTSLTMTETDTQRKIAWQYQDKMIHCESPHQAITCIDSDTVNPESVAAWCIEQLRDLLPDTIEHIRLSFIPEDIPHHFYHYSHGLKKHQGNCQRIAHGHRSTIEIIRDEQRQHDLEKQWCEQWRDIYIGSRADMIKKAHENAIEYYHFHYQAPQGTFTLRIPSDACCLIETETTVEFIAQHIANSLKQQHPQHKFTVKAFEGIGKGAIAFS